MSNGMHLPPEILAVIRAALAEDIGSGDATTNSIVPAETGMRGQIIAKQAGVIAGLDVARAVYQAMDAQVDFWRSFRGAPAVC
jgi:nicotinate-nucleotide pyrophosphorylase (carboxylating)